MGRSILVNQYDDLTRGITNVRKYLRTQQINEHLMNRLGLETTLEGHRGCVNCLEWNERGTHLASGSDDRCIIIWDPFERRSLLTLNTGHVANIFSVKFLPNLNENLVVTGAADNQIRVHDIGTMETRHVFSCHSGRVKRLANTSSEPYLFWSASEDGTCRQFDLRDPNQANVSRPRNVLVNLKLYGSDITEAKCLAINPLKPELLAVGGNDPFTRVYDRRYLTLSSHIDSEDSRGTERNCSNSLSYSPKQKLPVGTLQYFVPCHLPGHMLTDRGFHTYSVTSVSFSSNGLELLSNIGRDNIYLYNLKTFCKPFQCSGTENLFSSKNKGLLYNFSSEHSTKSKCISNEQHSYLAPDNLTVMAARHVENRAFVRAVHIYNDLISQWPLDAQLYAGRATALVKRGWSGDTYNALLDCRNVMLLKRKYVQSSFLSAYFENDSMCPDDLSIDGNPNTDKCMYLTALLLAVRCVLCLHWFSLARTLLKHAVEYFPFISKTGQLRAPLKISTESTNADNSQHKLNLENSKLSHISNSVQSSCSSSSSNNNNNNNNSSSNSSKSILIRVFERLEEKLLILEKQYKQCNKNKTKDTAYIKPTVFVDCDNFLSQRTVTPPSEQSGNQSDSENNCSPKLVHAVCEDSSSARWKYELDMDDESITCALCACLHCYSNRLAFVDEERDALTYAVDYATRYVGHCNTITDIKEANFFGSYGQYIVGGSDCGSFFIWDHHTTNIVRILYADSATVNCVQPHPSVCLLATSGIDPVVRLWSPSSEEDPDQSRVIKDHLASAERNHQRSNANPLELMLSNMGYRIPEWDLHSNRSRRSRRREQRQREHSDDSDDENVDDAEIDNSNNIARVNSNDGDGDNNPPENDQEQTTECVNKMEVDGRELTNDHHSSTIIGDHSEDCVNSYPEILDCKSSISKSSSENTEILKNKKSKIEDTIGKMNNFHPSFVANVFNSDSSTSDSSDSDQDLESPTNKSKNLTNLSKSKPKHFKKRHKRTKPERTTYHFLSCDAFFGNTESLPESWTINVIPINTQSASTNRRTNNRAGSRNQNGNENTEPDSDENQNSEHNVPENSCSLS